MIVTSWFTVILMMLLGGVIGYFIRDYRCFKEHRYPGLQQINKEMDDKYGRES